MDFNDILKRKIELQAQLDAISADIISAKTDVLKEILNYVKQFDISFSEIKSAYESAHLSTAIVQVVVNKKLEKKVPERKGYAYYNSANGKWFNGYQKFPKWFDLAKAGTYLVAGKTHTPMVAKAMVEHGVNKSPVKEALTQAETKHYKDLADQLNKLHANKKLFLLKDKAKKLDFKLKHVLAYCNDEVIELLRG